MVRKALQIIQYSASADRTHDNQSLTFYDLPNNGLSPKGAGNLLKPLQPRSFQIHSCASVDHIQLVPPEDLHSARLRLLFACHVLGLGGR